MTSDAHKNYQRLMITYSRSEMRSSALRWRVLRDNAWGCFITPAELEHKLKEELETACYYRNMAKDLTHFAD